jgi:hypothetical protein
MHDRRGSLQSRPRWHAVYFEHGQATVLIVDHIDAGKLAPTTAVAATAQDLSSWRRQPATGLPPRLTFVTQCEECRIMAATTRPHRDKNPKVAEAVAFDANKTLKIRRRQLQQEPEVHSSLCSSPSRALVNRTAA